MFSMRRKQSEKTVRENGDARGHKAEDHGKENEKAKKADLPPKKIPVFFIDEAHKL